VEPSAGLVQLDRRQLLMAAGFGVAAVLLGGCTDNDSSKGSSSGHSKKAGSGGPNLKGAETFLDSEAMDPAADADTVQLTSCMFDTVLRIDENGKVVPGIVTEYEVSADGAAWTMKMRDDVVFHDGTKVTSEDLAYAYQRSVGKTADERDFWIELLGEKPNVEIVDPTTIIVHTQGPQSLFIPYSTLYGSAIFVVPKAYIEDKGLDNFVKNPIGTGPYQFVKQVPG